MNCSYFKLQIEKMEQARDKQGDKNEIDDLIDALRKEKDHLEIKIASLQEQLSKSMCEIVKLKEQLLHVQEECRVNIESSFCFIIKKRLHPLGLHLAFSLPIFCPTFI